MRKIDNNIQSAIIRESKFIFELNLSVVEKIRLLLLINRMLAFDSSLLAVLHGSTAVTKKGNTILFGDGIDCKGKTMTALAVAKDSGKFLVDECSIYNEATGSIYGNPYYPLLIRADVGDLMKKEYGIGLKSKKNILILPSELGFDVPELGKIKAIVSPHIDTELKESNLKEETRQKIKFYKVALTANAHNMKLLDSSLDHVQADGDKNNKNRGEIIDRVIGAFVPNGLLEIPYYDAYLKKSTDIISLLKKEGL